MENIIKICVKISVLRSSAIIKKYERNNVK